MTTETKATTWAPWRSTFNCSEQCPGGRPCNCQMWYGSNHTHHICYDPECFCHSRERWEPRLLEWEPVATIGPVGHRINFVRYNGVVGFVPLGPKDLNFEDSQALKGVYDDGDEETSR